MNCITTLSINFWTPVRSRKWKRAQIFSTYRWHTILLRMVWKMNWKKLATPSEKMTAVIQLSANWTSNFSPRTCCERCIKHDKRELGLFKGEFHYAEKICLCSGTSCCFHRSTDKKSFSSKVWNQRTLEETSAGLLEKYRGVLEKKTDVQTTNRGSRTNQHSVCAHEQKKENCHIFIQNELFLTMEFTQNHSFCKLIAIIVHGT